jgi:hypothetical protein
MIREAAIPKPPAHTFAWMRQMERRQASSTARGTDIRPADSTYDGDFATATETLIADLRKAGHEVATPGTGAGIVDGIEVPAHSLDGVAAYSQERDIDTAWAYIQEKFGAEE